MIQAPKYNIGDKVRIVNYGHAVHTKKEEWKNMFEAGLAGATPNNILHEEDTHYVHDIRPEYVGQECIIKDISTIGKISMYSTTLFAWAHENQLELI